MAGKTLDISEFITTDSLAQAITDNWIRWDSLRTNWKTEKMELRNYIFATDTRKTSNASLPWKNSTTLPKLCQIRDNLHANYMAALFPNDNWLEWQGDDEEGVYADKRVVIEAYMKNKLREGNFETLVSDLVYDYIDNGNIFATSDYVVEEVEDEDGQASVVFAGPVAVRISPFDIVFNPTAKNFYDSPKIIKSIKSLGELVADVETRPESEYMRDVLDEIISIREKVMSLSDSDIVKNDGYQVDGFGSIAEYYGSGYVEILEFFGDIYDVREKKLHRNRIITVVDRCKVIRNVPNPSWVGNKNFQHAGWRLRPDNLWAMGPLDNLVGMQYRIDHLENLKADVFDLIATPMTKVQGDVEEWNYGPGERIYVGDEGDVQFMAPDTTALNADTQIALLEVKMEEIVGAPKQAMGIRTPGEKTKFEVQVLDNATNRIFMNKVQYFERKVIEPLLNQMLEQARRNMDKAEVVRILDDETDVVLFEKITRQDLNAKGKLRPVGARHFAQKANQLQNLVQFANTSLAADPAVNVHISGFKLAQLMEELLEIKKFGLVEKNVRLAEQTESAQVGQQGQEVLTDQAIQSGNIPGESVIGGIDETTA